MMFLESHAVDYEFIDFKKTAPTTDDIHRWEKFYKSLPVNKKGLTYRKVKEEFESLSDDDKVEFITSHSSMIKRPILQKKNKVLAMGFEEKEYQDIF